MALGKISKDLGKIIKTTLSDGKDIEKIFKQVADKIEEAGGGKGGGGGGQSDVQDKMKKLQEQMQKIQEQQTQVQKSLEEIAKNMK